MQQQLVASAGQWEATSSPSSTQAREALAGEGTMEGAALPVAAAPTLSLVEEAAAAT
jgi:hypothetical protein